jgi:hypothetical protein
MVDSAPTAAIPSSEPLAAQPPIQQDPTVTANSAPNLADLPPTQEAVNPDLNKLKKKPRKEGLNLGRLLSQNSFALAMGLGIGLLVVALMMVNKRKKSGGAMEEFNDDAFAAPNKKKRS